MSRFQHGNVMSLELSNFQIFEEQTLRFEPGLNLIAAPNGSGKSSVANALAFVFNGPVRMVGKGKELSEFVRFGESRAMIEATVWIEEAGKGRAVRLRRTMVTGRRIRGGAGVGCTSDFFVDGQLVTQRVYAEALLGWGVAVDSLCTFLPQERVAEFSGLGGAALLEEVLAGSGVGTADVYAKESELKVLEEEMESKRTRRCLLEGSMARMEAGMREEERRRELETRIGVLGYRMDCVRWREAKTSYEQARAERGRRREEAEREAKTMATERSRLAEFEESAVFAEHRAHLRTMETQNGEMREVVERIKTKTTEIEYRRAEAEGAAKRIREKEAEELAGGKRIVEMRRELEGKEEELTKMISELKTRLIKYYSDQKNMNGVNDQGESIDPSNIITEIKKVATVDEIVALIPKATRYDESIRTAANRIMQLQFQATGIQREMSAIEERLRGHSERRTARMELLRRYSADTHRAVQWLEKQRDSGLFEEAVLEPAFLHVGLEPEFSREIETLLSHQMLSSFIVANGRDFATLSRILKDEQRLDINIAEAIAPDTRLDLLDPAAVRRCGCDGTAHDFVDAPDAYRRLLCAYSGFGQIPIAHAQVDEAVLFDTLPQVRRLVTNGNYVEIRKLGGLHAGQTQTGWISTSSRIVARGLFTAPKVDPATLRTEHEALAGRRDALMREVATLLTQKEEAARQKSALASDFDLQRIRDAECRAASTRHSIALHERLVANTRAEIAVLATKAGDARDAAAVIRTALAREAADLCVLLGKKRIPAIDATAVKSIQHEIENSLRTIRLSEIRHEQASVAEQAAQQEMNQLKPIIKELKASILSNKYNNEQVSEKMKVNEQIQVNEQESIQIHTIDSTQTHTFDPTQTHTFDPTRSQYDSMHKQHDSIYNLPNEQNQSIAELAAEHSRLIAELAVMQKKSGVAEAFEANAVSKQRINESLESLTSRRATLVDQIIALRHSTARDINRLLAPIASVYQQMFRSLSLDARIDLGTEQRFELIISVRFRSSEELQPLSATRHSGGERALCTALFLLALQQSRPSTFRLVDEVNQGMDPANERAVFEIIRQMSLNSQFFIITPKLVDGIAFAENANVIILYGGAGITKDLEHYAYGLANVY